MVLDPRLVVFYRRVLKLRSKLDEKLTIRLPPYWTSLRSLSNSGLARAFILIPLIGYWIILNPTIVSSIARLSCHIEQVAFKCKEPSPPPTNPTVPPVIETAAPKAEQVAPWRLFATYFGLC